MTELSQAATIGQARTGPMPTGGRWGWYRDHEGNEFRRVSTLVKFVETDRYNLDLWFRRQVAEGLAIRDDLVLALKAMGRPDPLIGWTQEQKRKIDSIVKDAMQAAKQSDGARQGTAVHDLTERLDRGEDVEAVVRGLPATAAQSLRAYDFLRRENGWRSVEIERTVVCDELEVAGTFDRVDLIPGLAALLGPGECQYGHTAAGVAHDPGPDAFDELPVIDDVKTEKEPWRNGLHIAPQLAIYSRARRMWRATGGTVPLLDGNGNPKLYPSGDPILIPNGEYVPAPCVRQDVAVVVHVLDGKATPLFVNLTEGWEAAQAARIQADREARAKRSYGSAGAWFAEVPGIKRPKVAEMLVAQAASKDVMNGHALPEGAPSFGTDVAADGTMSIATAQPTSDGTTHYAVQRGDGLTEWTTTPPAGQLDEVDRSAIEAVWAKADLAGLAEVYRIYTETIGRTWGGRVAEAGEARRRQIECPQRELHTSGKCPCGWTAGIPA